MKKAGTKSGDNSWDMVDEDGGRTRTQTWIYTAVLRLTRNTPDHRHIREAECCRLLLWLECQVICDNQNAPDYRAKDSLPALSDKYVR